MLTTILTTIGLAIIIWPVVFAVMWLVIRATDRYAARRATAPRPWSPHRLLGRERPTARDSDGS